MRVINTCYDRIQVSKNLQMLSSKINPLYALIEFDVSL